MGRKQPEANGEDVEESRESKVRVVFFCSTFTGSASLPRAQTTILKKGVQRKSTHTFIQIKTQVEDQGALSVISMFPEHSSERRHIHHTGLQLPNGPTAGSKMNGHVVFRVGEAWKSHSALLGTTQCCSCWKLPSNTTLVPAGSGGELLEQIPGH